MMRSEVKDAINDDEEEIWGFVYEKVVAEKKYPIVSQRLWQEYIAAKGKTWTTEELNEVFYGDLTENLHNSFLEDEKILALFKALRIKFDEHMLRLFQTRTCAKLKVRNDVLIDFRLAGNPSCVTAPTQRQVQVPPPEQRRVPSPPEPQRRDPPQRRNSPPNLPQRQDTPHNREPSPGARKSKNDEITPEIEKEMWNCVLQSFGRVPNNEFSLHSFWVTFALSKNLTAALGYDLTQHFRTMFAKIYSMPIDLKIKMELMKDLKFKMTNKAEQTLLTVYNVEVELDDECFIENWRLHNSNPVEKRETRQQENVNEHRNESRTTQRNLPNVQAVNSSGNLQTWRPRSRNNENASREDEIADAQRVNIPRSPSPRHPIRLRSVTPPEKFQKVVQPVNKSDDEQEEEDIKVDIKPARRFFSEIDHIKMAKFLHKEISSSEAGEIQPKGNAIWRKFIKESGSSRTPINLASHYRKIFQNVIYKLAIDRVMILELYKNLRITVDKRVQTKMKDQLKTEIKFVEDCVASWKFVEQKSPPNKRRRYSSSSTSSSMMVVEETVKKDKRGTPVLVSGVEEKRKRFGNNESEEEPSPVREREDTPMIETESDEQIQLVCMEENGEQNGGAEQVEEMEVDQANEGDSMDVNPGDEEWNSLLHDKQNETSETSALPVQEEAVAEAEEVAAELRNDSGVEDETLDDTASLPNDPEVAGRLVGVKIENESMVVEQKPSLEVLRVSMKIENAGETENNNRQLQNDETENDIDGMEDGDIVDENLDGEALNKDTAKTQKQVQNVANEPETDANDHLKEQGREILVSDPDFPLSTAVQLHFKTEIEDILKNAKEFSKGEQTNFVTMVENMRGVFLERVKSLTQHE